MSTQNSRRPVPRILVVSSQVLVGRVGISVIAPAYAKLEIEGFYLPTLLLSSRPGLGTQARHEIPAQVLDTILASLDADGRLDAFDGVMTGYFARADQVFAVAGHLRKLRQRRSNVALLVDPVIGDRGAGLYVPEQVAEAIRGSLMPLASIATPNRFELEWLAGNPTSDDDGVDAGIAREARDLGPGCVVVTSASTSQTVIETRLITKTQVLSHAARRVEGVPNGTGDLFAGLFMAAVCTGQDPARGLVSASTSLESVVRESSGKEWLDLASLDPAFLDPTSLDTASPDRATPADAPMPRTRQTASRTGSDWVAGVDGCRQGWAVVFRDLTGRCTPRFRMIPTFIEILDAPEAPRIVAVDMPIGLPARVGAGGRGPESAVRPYLGQRQSSVFSIPSRSAVYAPDYRTACARALETSTPPRKVSKQGFMLFEKIRQIDAVMTPELCDRVFEVHPELAFWRLNGGYAMQTPKKIKGRINPDGIAERRALLEVNGFAPDFFDQDRPKGVGLDDFVDAGACSLIAVRLAAGDATPFPDNPKTDARGLTIAIWA